MRASDLGLDNDHGSFDYQSVSYSTDRVETPDGFASYGTPLDRTPTLSYNVAALGIVFADAFTGPLYKDLPNTTISFRTDGEVLAAHKSEGVLLLHHHNTLSTRAEVVRLAEPPTAREYRVLVPVAAR